MTVFHCEDSPDGIFTGIYDAWASRLGHRNVRLEVKEGVNYTLFEEYKEVMADGVKAEKVAGTIRTRLGEDAWYHIYHASLSGQKREKADAIYRAVVLGLALDGEKPGSGKRLMEYLTNPFVYQLFELSRAVSREECRYVEFLRFREMGDGFLFGEIQPEAQVLPLMGDHIANRFPNENFLILDRSHEIYLLHSAGKPWVLFQGGQIDRDALRETEKEKKYARLWQRFVDTIAIEERRNPGLQRQLLPLKFRKFMTEKY